MPLSNRKPRFSMYGLIWGMLLTVAPAIAEVNLTRYELTNAQLSDLNKGEVVVVKLPPPGDAGVRFRAFKKMLSPVQAEAYFH